MKTISKLGLMLVAGLTLCASAVAGPITVDVGYADGLRGTGFFPSPWSGDPGIVFLGITGPGADAGAIKINNTSGASLVVNSVAVSINGTPVAPPWALPVTLAAGESLILTETVHYDFDTSDIAFIPGASFLNPAVGCDGAPGHASICPTVTIAVNGGAGTVYLDSGHVLDTEGFDFASVGNESFAWRPIGTFGGPAGGTAPEPATLALLGISMLGFAATRRRKTR